jgi:hypothetical protein
MQERESISKTTLMNFLNTIVGIRMRSNNHVIWGELISVGPEVVIRKGDGRRVIILASDIIDISEAKNNGL